ncbi:MAG: hypothetical protein ACOYM2_22045, partial [Rectinemataceae bacterium]
SRVKDWHIVDRAEGRAEGLAEGLAEGRIEGLADGRIEGLADGRIEGLADGRIEGKTEGALETARRLKGLGIDSAIIAEGTGLTPEEVEKA